MNVLIQKRGFTLIELLVVIAIIAILAAILFPVFARAREKARQSTCISNQRQISASILMFAQDHEETLPTSTTVWKDLSIDQGVLVCPTKGKSYPNGYGYLASNDGTSLGDIPDPAATYLTADTTNTTKNLLVVDADIDKRHSGMVVCSYGDGHVSVDKLTKSLATTSIDLMDSSVMPPAGAFPSPYSVWTRSPAADNTWSYSTWSATGGSGSYTIGVCPNDGVPKPCIAFDNYGGAATCTLTRTLDTYSNLTQWSYSGYLYTYPGGNRSLEISVQNAASAAIVTLRRDMVTTVGTHRLKLNGVDIFPYGTSTTDQIVDGYCTKWLPFKFTVSASGTILEYGTRVWTMPNQTTAWNNPAKLIFSNINQGHGGGMRVDGLKFGIVQ